MPYMVAAALAVASALIFLVIRCIAPPKPAALASKTDDPEQAVNPVAGSTELTVASDEQSLGGPAGESGVSEETLDELKESLRALLISKNYAEALDHSKHPASEVNNAKKLVKQLIAQALPSLPAGEGKAHIDAYAKVRWTDTWRSAHLAQES